MTTISPLLPLFFKYRKSLTSRDFIIDYFVDAELQTEEEAIASKMIKLGKLFTKDSRNYVVTEVISKKQIGKAEEIFLPEHYKLNFYTKVKLTKGMIENYSKETIEETTLGVFFLNEVVLVKAFGDVIPYTNGLWNVNKIEDLIAKEVISKKITPEQVLRYVDYTHFLASLSDFVTPGLSEKSITANLKVVQRRDELLVQYKDQLRDPNIMMMIENELIKLDKEEMKGDISEGFLIKGKNYDVQRKRMFSMIGMVESFGEETSTYNFSTTNLNDGWKPEEMPLLANDIRRGVYGRAKSTALGGTLSKSLGRNFQDSAIVEDDCGTKLGLPILLTKTNSHHFLNKNILVENKTITLTESNIANFLNKTISVRSPMKCQAKNGYCYACMDSRFKETNTKLLNIHPIAIGSKILSNSLKAMHGLKVDILEVTDLNSLLI